MEYELIQERKEGRREGLEGERKGNEERETKDLERN